MYFSSPKMMRAYFAAKLRLSDNPPRPVDTNLYFFNLAGQGIAR